MNQLQAVATTTRSWALAAMHSGMACGAERDQVLLRVGRVAAIAR